MCAKEIPVYRNRGTAFEQNQRETGGKVQVLKRVDTKSFPDFFFSCFGFCIFWEKSTPHGALSAHGLPRMLSLFHGTPVLSIHFPRTFRGVARLHISQIESGTDPYKHRAGSYLVTADKKRNMERLVGLCPVVDRRASTFMTVKSTCPGPHSRAERCKNRRLPERIDNFVRRYCFHWQRGQPVAKAFVMLRYEGGVLEATRCESCEDKSTLFITCGSHLQATFAGWGRWVTRILALTRGLTRDIAGYEGSTKNELVRSARLTNFIR